MTCFRALFSLLLLALSSSLFAQPTIFHVAPPPAGRDTNTGKPGSPFATLDRARLAVREHLATSKPGDILVEIHPGNYELTAPLRFDAKDSGRPDARVIYRGIYEGHVIVSGGRELKGWSQDPSGLARTSLPSGTDFRQLWVDGRRAIRARTPNAGQTLQFTGEKQSDGFDVPADLLKDLTIRPGEIEFSVLITWMHKRLRIDHLAESPTPGQVRAVIAAPEWDAVVNQPQGNRNYLKREYWMENARSFLDAPGEFFLDRDRLEVLYQRRPDEPDLPSVAIRPELEHLILLEGTPEAPVQYLQFERLTFAYTGWTRPNHSGFVDVQANSLIPVDPKKAVDQQYRHSQRKDRIPAAFHAVTADNIILKQNRFIHLGGTAVIFTQGGDENLIERNYFYDIAGGGIELGQDAARPASPRLFPRRNRIMGNVMSHVGQDYYGSVAILGYYTTDSLIAQNEIANVPYTAISQGWGWGNPDTPPESRGNHIHHNWISNYMRHLDDGGGIYTVDRQLGSEIVGNYVAHMRTPDPKTETGGALYLDQFTQGFRVFANVVENAPRWLFIWNANIRENHVNNNYADTAALRNDGTNNSVEPARVSSQGHWPGPAKALIEGAGLPWPDQGAREVGVEGPIISDTTGVDFQVLHGNWSRLRGTDESYTPWRLQTNEPGARVSWTPTIPKSGFYLVRIWQSPDSGPGTVSLVHADGRMKLPLPAGSDQGQWVELGPFPFKAGFTAEIILSAPESSPSRPVIADAIRLDPSRDPFQRVK